LAETRFITVPPVYWQPAHLCILSPYKDIRFAEAVLEKRLGDITPDLILRNANNRELFVEIAITHKSAPEKIHKLVARGASALECHLPECEVVTREAIRQVLQRTSGTKLWLFNAKAAAKRRDQFGDEADGLHRTYKPIVERYAYFPVETFPELMPSPKVPRAKRRSRGWTCQLE
jgi:hypothetical protein